MRLLLLISLCLGSLLVCPAQKALTIDVYRLGQFRRYHIYPNQELVYKLRGSNHKHRQKIVDLEDSVLFIETGESIRLDRIKTIIIDRSNFLTRLLANGFRTAGLGYIVIDSFNNLKEGDRPVFKEQVLAVGAALFVVGEAIHVANKRRLRPGRNTRLQILDFGLIP